VDRQAAIDTPLPLAELLDGETLAAVLSPLCDGSGLSLSIEDESGRALVGSAPEPGRGEAVKLPLTLSGRKLGAVVVEGQSDVAAREALGRRAIALMDPLLRQAEIRHLTSRLHRQALSDLEAEVQDRDRRLARSLAQLREVDRLKANFLATVSHELRTPLTSVIGYAEMMLDGMAGDLSRQQRECLDTILEKADELLQLITGLLDASLLESRSLNIQPEPISLSQIAEIVARALAQEARRQDIQLVLPKVVVPRAHGDEGKIRQVMLHLVANAIKFSPRGAQVIIDLDVAPMTPRDRANWAIESREPSGRVGLRVRVHDKGIGIADDQRERIFEPFFQVDSSTTREFGGTGLGLSLAKLYVEAHGGNIWVESQMGKGSVFTVTIPAVAEELKRYAARKLAEEHG
jgi:signal transduction histidine kinase